MTCTGAPPWAPLGGYGLFGTREGAPTEERPYKTI